jgi:hypothetical protein
VITNNGDSHDGNNHNGNNKGRMTDKKVAHGERGLPPLQSKLSNPASAVRPQQPGPVAWPAYSTLSFIQSF